MNFVVGDSVRKINKLNKRFQNVIYRLSNIGSLPSDSEAQQLRKAILIFLTTSYCVVGVIWGMAYLALGLPFSASIPFGYSVVSGASLYHFLRTKHYEFFCFSQLTLILALPFLLQWSLGGFAASGAVMLWSILSPVGALMFAGTARALPWFLAYVLISVLSGILDGRFLPPSTLPSLVIVISFVMNIGGVSAIVFVLLKYFVSERERAMAALDEAHRLVRHSLTLAMEVQQSLLPKTNPKVNGLDIAGKSIYCDETGGDYYDFLNIDSSTEGKIGVVVGDVSGHGIPSALLMAGVRAYLHGRATRPGSPAEIVTDVNRLVSADTVETGQFMTLFFLVIEARTGRLSWVRAGHDPAIIYSPDSDQFEELKGDGLPLGVNEDWSYEEYTVNARPGQILILTTDGVWETHNAQGEMFGKERFKEVIRRNAGLRAKGIHLSIIEAVSTFRGEASQEDDLTLVVSKFL